MAAERSNNYHNIFTLKSHPLQSIWYYCSPTETQNQWKCLCHRPNDTSSSAIAETVLQGGLVLALLALLTPPTQKKTHPISALPTSGLGRGWGVRTRPAPPLVRTTQALHDTTLQSHLQLLTF